MATKDQPETKQSESSSDNQDKPANVDIRINLLSQVAKQLKVVGAIAAVLSLPLAVTMFMPSQQPTAYPVAPEVSPSPQAVGAEGWRCRFGGGEWREFSNSCADQCGTQDQLCAQVVTEGCECGDGQCWDGEKCVLESEYSSEITTMEPALTSEE